MEIKNKINDIYQHFLRKTEMYAYFLSYLENCLDKEQLDQVRQKLLDELHKEFYFLPEIPKSCLTLAYQDSSKSMKDNSTKKH